MIMTLVVFKLEKPWTREAGEAVARETVAELQGATGLLSTEHFLSPEGSRTGLLARWDERADAERFFAGAAAALAARYGSAPSVAYLMPLLEEARPKAKKARKRAAASK